MRAEFAETAQRCETCANPVAYRLLLVDTMRIALLTLLAAACAHPGMPPRLGEGTTVLAPGKVGVTVAGGGGLGNYEISGNPLSARGVGFEARARLGLAHDQEVGISGLAGLSLTDLAQTVAGGALSYKIALHTRFALVGELGVMDKLAPSTVIFAGSVAAIAAPYMASDGSQLYVGLKGTLSVPVLQNASATDELIALPVGYSWRVSERVELIAEAGFGIGFEQTNSGGTTTETSGYGGYTLIAFGYKFR